MAKKKSTKHTREIENLEQRIIAEYEGRNAWMCLVVNHMLSTQYLRPRQYRWERREIAQLVGMPVTSLNTIAGLGTVDGQTNNL